MAIKQQLLDTTPEAPIYDLGKIMQMLEMIQDGSFNTDEHLIGHTCEELVRCLGKIQPARDKSAVSGAKEDVLKIRDLYQSICEGRSLIIHDIIIRESFAALYKMITKEDQVSPYAGIVLNLYEEPMIKDTVQHMLKMPHVTDEAIKKALNVLCEWLKAVECAPTLSVWIREILQALKVS